MTLPLYIYVLKQNSYNECIYIYTYIYIHIYINRASGREPRSSGGKTSNPQVSALVPRPVVNGMERMCQRHGSDQTPTFLFESKNHVSIIKYNICSSGIFVISNSNLRNCVIVAKNDSSRFTKPLLFSSWEQIYHFVIYLFAFGLTIYVKWFVAKCYRLDK